MNLSAQQLRKAADLQERIESLQGELGALLRGTQLQVEAPTPSKSAGKRQISAAGIERIRAAQRARWAKAKKGNAAAKPAGKPKRRISAAARQRLSALATARWAKAKQQGKTSL